MNWIRRMANVVKNLSKKGRADGLPPRSRSTNAHVSTTHHGVKSTRASVLKSQSTSAMESKSDGLVESMKNLSLGRNRVRSAVRIPSRAGSSGSTALETLDDLCYFIQNNKVKNVVVMAGAGISTSSGIPDFRTPGTGLYSNLKQYKIPYPEAIFDIDYFHYNPRPFFTLAKELYPNGVYQPNAAHYFCRLLHDKGMLLRMYTQNIDGLERVAGIPANKLVEAHGTFSTATCVQCRRKYEGDEIKYEILNGKLPLCRNTLSCTGIIKPDIVFFGEDLPKKFWYYLKDFPQADMLIVMGTSLEVQPFAGIVDYVRFPVPRVLFNLKAVGPFKKRRRMNDVAIQGDLVKNVCLFMHALRWQNDYHNVADQPLPKYEDDTETKNETNKNNSTDSPNPTISNGNSDSNCNAERSKSSTIDDPTSKTVLSNGNANENKSEIESDQSNSKSDPAKKKVNIILPLRRNETPIQKDRFGTTVNNTKSETNLKNSSPVKNRKLHTLSANPNRLLTKRGSTGSLTQKAGPVTVRTPRKPVLPKLAQAQQRVDAYKETLEKLRRWRMDSTSESSCASSSSSSGDSSTG